MFGLQWLAVCTLGVTVFGLLAVMSMWSVGETVAESMGESAGAIIAGSLFGILFALGASLGPGLQLQKKGLSATRWITYSTVAGGLGMGISFATAFRYFDTLPDNAAIVLIGIGLGLPVGIAQWLVLREQNVENKTTAKWWPAISVIGYAAGVLVPIRLGSEGNEWLVMIIGGLILGVVTGAGMAWILRQQAANT